MRGGLCGISTLLEILPEPYTALPSSQDPRISTLLEILPTAPAWPSRTPACRFISTLLEILRG